MSSPQIIHISFPKVSCVSNLTRFKIGESYKAELVLVPNIPPAKVIFTSTMQKRERGCAEICYSILFLHGCCGE